MSRSAGSTVAGTAATTFDRCYDNKHLQHIALTLDPLYSDISRYIDIVKNFIAEKGGVIYGGTAIDYALRLRGDAIYDDADLAVPDLDFYMPDSVAAAYQLAEIIHRARNDGDSSVGQTRAIVAMHVETMRVDCGDNHFIADISYFPEPLFSRIPTIIYSGMRCVHPDYQRADIHSALSFPFDNAPLEVIFARWKGKDIPRLNKIDALYPIQPPREFLPPLTETHLLDENRPLFGWAAYAALMSGQPCDMPVSFAIVPGKGQLRATFHTKRGIEYAAHEDMPGQKFARYAGLLLPRTEAGGNITYYDTSNRLLSVVRVRRDSRDILCACPQSVLQYMLAVWFIHGDAAALMAYCNLWDCVKKSDAPHYKLSIETYGTTNIDSAQLAQIARLENQPTDLPSNYYPGRQNREAPTFSYNSHHFKIQGESL